MTRTFPYPPTMDTSPMNPCPPSLPPISSSLNVLCLHHLWEECTTPSTKASTNNTQRNPSAFEYVEAVDLIDDEIQMPSSQPSPSIRPPPTFIRPPTSYSEPSMTRFSSTPYFEPPPPMRLRLRRKHLVQARCTVNGPSNQAQNDFTFWHQQGRNDEEIRWREAATGPRNVQESEKEASKEASRKQTRKRVKNNE